MHRLFARRRGPLLVTALAVLAACLGTIPAATATPAPHHQSAAAGSVRANDVYLRDNLGDNSSEPDPVTPVWASPDIWVCNTPAPCGGVNPIVGPNPNYVNLRLNNTGPGTVTGDVYLYYTSMGGAAVWPTNWTPIATAFGVPVPASGMTVQLPWWAPGPGHFCLLARFVSASDPMTFPEGPNTLVNTANDNNIAWHNVDTVGLGGTSSASRPFTLGNANGTAVRANLVITPGQFVGPGKLTVDLGPTLGKAWLAEGAPGIGVQPAGGTLVQILDPRQAVIEGLPIQPKERFQTTLTFTASAPVSSTVLVDETDSNGADMGGVSFTVDTGQQGG